MPKARREQIHTLELPRKVLSAAQFCRVALLGHPWQTAIAALLAELYDDLLADPILMRIGERYPEIKAYVESPWRQEVGLDPVLVLADATSSFDITDVDGMPAVKEALDVARIRGDRVAAPVIHSFIALPTFPEMVQELIAYVFPPGGPATMADSLDEYLEKLLTEERMPAIRDMAEIAVELAFLPGAIVNTRARAMLLVEALTARREANLDVAALRTFLGYLATDVLTPARSARAKELAQWTVQTLLQPGCEWICKQFIGRVVSALMDPDHHEQTTRHLAGDIAWLMEMPLLLAAEVFIDPDPAVITVREAAVYLGLKPRSVRTHIETCAGTEHELHTWMVKKGRGKGTAAMRLEDLVAWEEEYWRPIRRERRA